ncbi:MAG: lysophospholipid acyltransferase family protein [Phycisphaerales bacterium]
MARTRRQLPTFLHAPVYAGLRSCLAALGALPPEGVSAALCAAARAFAGAPFNRARLARAVENLGIAFPTWNDAVRHEHALRAYEHLFLLAAETATLPRKLTTDGWPRAVELGPVGSTLERLMRDQPVILITGHCGNWELLGYTLSVLDFPVHALYRPLDLKPLNDWVKRSRGRSGLILIDKFGAGDNLPEIIGTGGVPAFVADQNAGDRGLFVPFFGRLASTYKSIGLLALHANAAVVCGMARRLPGPHADGVRYRMETADVIEPAQWRGQPDPLFYITARYRRAIEALVRLAPEQYLWMHRYWKSRPRHERLGKPFPGALREKLAQLPWMTPDELERIVDQIDRDSGLIARPAAPAST